MVNPEEEKDLPVGFSSEQIVEAEVDKDTVAVVAGVNFSFSYRTICMASLYLELNKAVLISTNQDRVFSTQLSDRKMPAGGSMIKAIEACTLVKAVNIGKP